MGSPRPVPGEFRTAFPTWREFDSFVQARAPHPEFDADRALHQVITVDFLSRLMAATPARWMLFGSLSLPARPDPADPWPPDLVPAWTGLPARYTMARTAFDLDLTMLDAAGEGADFGAAALAAVDRVTSRDIASGGDRAAGLDGLVTYTADVEVRRSGRVIGAVTAHPVDQRDLVSSGRVDDPVTIEVDIKPPNWMRLFGSLTAPRVPLTALSLPGFADPRPLLYPTVSQLADKITEINGPPSESAPDPGGAPWHRYKDVFDIYYMIRTCRLDGAQLAPAVEVNNRVRGRPGPPVPFHLHGYHPAGATGQLAIPWREGCDALRTLHPQLARYPNFDAMLRVISEFTDSINPEATWIPHCGWRRAARSEIMQDASTRAWRQPGFPGTPARPAASPGRRARPGSGRDAHRPGREHGE